MRSPLAFVLVLHYFLTGVLGGLWATVTRDEVPSAAHPYVHSVLCQSHNYLRLDCFDTCNGHQSGQVLKKLVTGDDPVNSPQGAKEKVQLDIHVLADLVVVPARPRYARAPRSESLLLPPAVAPGVFAVEGPPPKVLPAFAG